MRRFIAPELDLSGDSLEITGELYAHLVRVLRLSPGERFMVANGKGKQVEAELERIERGTALARICAVVAEEGTGAQCPAITIYHALPKGDKLDMVIEKGTELGAAAFVVFVGERSVARPDRQRLEGRLERWRRIAREAARQSGRSDVPVVDVVDGLEEVLQQSQEEVRLILWEEEHSTTLGPLMAQAAPPSVGIIIGPEGGLAPREVAAARQAGYCSVTLGPRILRTETAGLAVLAILQAFWGDMG